MKEKNRLLSFSFSFCIIEVKDSAVAKTITSALIEDTSPFHLDQFPFGDKVCLVIRAQRILVLGARDVIKWL